MLDLLRDKPYIVGRILMQILPRFPKAIMYSLITRRMFCWQVYASFYTHLIPYVAAMSLQYCDSLLSGMFRALIGIQDGIGITLIMHSGRVRAEWLMDLESVLDPDHGQDHLSWFWRNMTPIRTLSGTVRSKRYRGHCKRRVQFTKIV